MKTRLTLALVSCATLVVADGFTPVYPAPPPSQPTSTWTTDKARSANAAIMKYLGEPVPPPSDLDPKYTAEGLIAAWKTTCTKLGFELDRLAVDDTEFPFLLFGTISGNHDFQALPATLRAMPGYAYGGSVVGRNNGTTYFSVNLMPYDQFSPAQREAIQRRLMIRLQMLAAIRSD